MPWETPVVSQTIYQSRINKISNLLWLSNHGAEIFLFILAIYAVVVIILWSIHNITKKRYKNNKQMFFLECDEIISLFAKEQYQNKYQENINTTLLTSLFESKSKDYLLEKKIFEDQIKQIENKIWKTIVNQEKWNRFYKYYNKTKWSSMISKSIWRLLTIITLWIYRIFM